jgi:phosphatidylserine/phosphatidylglycerophosphate/cardiolipin synthase-like enzyme
MSIKLTVYDNGDHACIVWLPEDEKLIPDCFGFAIRRICDGKEDYLHGYIGFSDDDKFDPANPWKFPVQRYIWWDYGVKPGNVVQYSVVPVLGPDKTKLKLSLDAASALTEKHTISGQASAHVSAYFNKGIVSAQWVSRAIAALGTNVKLADLINTPGNVLRNSLSGLLRLQILQLLADVKKNNGHIYAALYELNDPELIVGLKALGKNCHLILANGAFKPPDNDENKALRSELKNIVDLSDRLVTSGHFAHNKFVVFCDAGKKPLQVLSGSTNWTKTGLCTQANNGVIVDDAAIAQDFLDQWNLLKDAGNGYPASLAKTNSLSKTIQIDGGTITQWFAPTSAGQDLDYARNLIKNAKDGILFLFFNPGSFVAPDQPEKWTLLQNVLDRKDPNSKNFDSNLYIKGVVNQEIDGLTKPSVDGQNKATVTRAINDPSIPKNPVTLFNSKGTAPQVIPPAAMVPKNIKDKFHNWETEILGAGVHIHSKVVVIDPFGEHPVVMTGSHNLGYKASTKNDDNLMIIEGNSALAASFAVNIIAIYQNYRWNAYVTAHAADPRVWHGLVDTDQWQSGYLTGNDLAEIKFWLNNRGSSPVIVPALAAASVGDIAKKTVSPKKVVPKKAAPKKAAQKKTVPKKAAPKKAAPKKTVPKKAAPKKAAPKKAAPKKAAPKKAAPKKAAPKKAAPKKAAPKKAAPKKDAPKKSPPKKAAPKKAAPVKTVKKSTPKKTAVKKAVSAKKKK